MIKSYGPIFNNWSFGFQVDKSVEFEDIKKKPHVIKNQLQFATCSGYTRVRTTTDKFYFQVPISYFHPKFRSEKAFKAWEDEMTLMGGNVKYLGTFPWAGRPFYSGKSTLDGYNTFVLLTMRAYDYIPSQLFLKEDLWATFELNAYEYNNALKTYHSFCLFRYLWSWHYHKIVDVYYDIKQCLCKTNPEPFEILQLALYSFDKSQTTEGLDYHPTYCHVKINAGLITPIMTQKEFNDKINIRTDNAYIQNIFTRKDGNLDAVKELIKQRKYKKAYDILKS